MIAPKMTEDERRWRAESDARTLVEAEVIKQDASRKKAASEAAKRLAEKEKAEARAMSRVARMSPTKKRVKRNKKK